MDFTEAQKMIQQNNEWSAQQAAKQMEFQERMSNTAHQREIEDLKAAGLNPVLSAKLGGASTPSGAMGDTDTSGTSTLISMMMSAMNTAGSAARAAANATDDLVDNLGTDYGISNHYADLVFQGDDAKTAAYNAGKSLVTFGNFAGNVIGAIAGPKAGNAVKSFFRGQQNDFANMIYNNKGWRWMYNNQDKMRETDDLINNRVKNTWESDLNKLRNLLNIPTHHSGKF